uniref:Putative adenylosuccinate synthase n=1 Tax=viral metagenome TaxID=1070528 RepID=A0A6M3LGP4_9ZZZZ
MGGQFGSEGKGSFVSWLTSNNKYNLVIRNGAPNSGHTYVNKNNERKILRCLPCSNGDYPIYIPSGAVLNLDILNNELQYERILNNHSEIFISPYASIIQQHNIEIEHSIMTGSTYQGVGAARADKCLRKGILVKDLQLDKRVSISIPTNILNCDKSNILIESTQGYGLSLNSRYYPYCTSQNITPYQILDDADIPPNIHSLNIIMLFRTFPIRIHGNSGYLYNETNWQFLRNYYGRHIPVEKTSVTKKVRRVGLFDYKLAREAISRCNPTQIALTFMDYIYPNYSSLDTLENISSYLTEMESLINHKIDYIGLGTGKIVQRIAESIYSVK